jgi:hypothetical protein
MLSTTAEFAMTSTRRNGVYAGQPTIPVFIVTVVAAVGNVLLTAVYLYLKERDAGSKKAGTLFKSTIIVELGEND